MNFKKIINMSLATAVSISPIVALVACNGAKDGTDKDNEGANDTFLLHDGVKYYLASNGSEFDKDFGKFDNINQSDTTAKKEDLFRGVMGDSYTLRSFTKEMKLYKDGFFKDLPFNTSWVKLRDKSRIKAYKDTQGDNGQLILLDPTNTNASNTKSSLLSSKDNKGYVLDNWQYLDILNSWGGSGGSGYFVFPSSDWINVSHRNGVPITGTFFAAPGVFGGKISETKEILKPDANGDYPIAHAMVAMAKEMGFDGWTINFETEVSNEDWFTNNIKKFMNYIIKLSEENGQIIQLYGSIKESGVPGYQKIDNSIKNLIQFDDKVSESLQYLVDYRHATPNSIKTDKEFLKTLGLDDKRVSEFASYGLDVQKLAWSPLLNEKIRNLYNSNIDVKNEVSAWLYQYRQIFDPLGEEGIDKFWSSSNETGDVRYNPLSDTSIPDENDSSNVTDYWINNFTDKKFISMSNLYREKTVLNERKNFSSSFNRGIGDDFYIDGAKVDMEQYTEEGYTSIATQDILPTFRWWIDTIDENGDIVSDPNVNSEETIKGTINRGGESYFGSNSLMYKGSLKPNYSLHNKLYAVDFSMKKGDKFEIIHKSGDDITIGALVYNSKDEKIEPKFVKTADDKNGWKKSTFILENDLDDAKSFGINIKNGSGNQNDLENLQIGSLSYKISSDADEDKSKDTNFVNPKVQGKFKTYNGSKYISDPATYRLIFDSITNSDDTKFAIYEIWNGSEYVKQGFTSSMGIILKNISNENIVTINETKYLKVKIAFYDNQNKFKNDQYILVEM